MYCDEICDGNVVFCICIIINSLKYYIIVLELIK